MDINDVINLTAEAADSVLRFRVTAFGTKAFIDLKAFKTTIKTSIRALARDKGFSEDLPLACVVDFAGTAAFRAAKKWNSTANKKNHVDDDWLRNSVTSLVGGVVSEIGYQAHHQLQTYDPFALSDEYLDPVDGQDDLNVAEQSSGGSRSYSPRSPGVTSYYGLEPANTAAAGDDSLFDDILEPLPPRHQMTEGWRAVTKYAARPLSRAAADECETTIATLALPRKRPCPPDRDDDDDDGDSNGHEQNSDEEEATSEAESEVLQPVAKRPRVWDAARSPTVATSRSPSRAFPSPGADDGAATASPGASGQPRKVNNRVPWTKEEERLLVKLRNEGKGWDVIHQRLNRASRGACQKKYYHLQDKRNTADAQAIGNEIPGSPEDEAHEQAQRMPRI